jgi:uncharacterized membrane protein
MEPTPKTEEKYIRQAFFLSLVFKAGIAAIETLCGFVLLFTTKIILYLTAFIQNQLIEDPRDYFATHLQHLLPYFTNHSQRYVSFYLLAHGIVKLVLIVELFRKKLWAYPATVIFLFLFIVYQVFRLLTDGYSLTLFLLTVLDLILIWLTWHEYRVMKKHFTKRPLP